MNLNRRLNNIEKALESLTLEDSCTTCGRSLKPSCPEDIYFVISDAPEPYVEEPPCKGCGFQDTVLFKIDTGEAAYE